MSETDLAKRVVTWLQDQHWEVYQEVQFHAMGGIADIAAVRAGLLWIIECKTSLTFTVLEQASRWPTHFRSIAVPQSHTGGRSMAYTIAKNYLQIGIIELGPYGPQQYYPPPPMREYHKQAKRMMAKLTEEHKTYLAAGSNGGGYLTPYRITIDSVKRYIAQNQGCTLKEIMTNLQQHHYSSDACARSSIRKALEDWERAWCEIKMIDGKNRYFVKQGVNR